MEHGGIHCNLRKVQSYILTNLTFLSFPDWGDRSQPETKPKTLGPMWNTFVPNPIIDPRYSKRSYINIKRERLWAQKSYEWQGKTPHKDKGPIQPEEMNIIHTCPLSHLQGRLHIKALTSLKYILGWQARKDLEIKENGNKYNILKL